MSTLHRFAFILLIFLSLQTYSQSGYDLDFNRELGLFTGGGLSIALGLKLKTNTVLYDSFHQPPKSNISQFDRVAISNYSLAAKNTSDYMGYTSFALPLVFLLNPASKADIGKITLIWGEVIAINAGLTGLSKHAFKRPRPYVYSTQTGTYPKSTHSAQSSFVSGHTSVMASNMFFFARTFATYFPESKLKPYVWGISVLAPAVMGHLRVKAGVHYPTDILAGYALGAGIGLLVPALHKNKRNQNLTVFSIGDGMGVRLTF